MLQTSVHWDAALNLFDQDKVEEAWNLIKDADIGDGANLMEAAHIIEGEYLTGLRSQILTVAPDLEVEAIESELPCSLQQLGEMARSGRNRVANVLGNLQGHLLVTVLSREAMTPAPFAELGYVRPSALGFKMCISPEASGNTALLESAIASLEAARAAFQMSDGKAAPWLLTAAMAASGERVQPGTRRSFCAGELPWLKPKDLSARVAGRSSEEERLPTFRVARSQSLLIGQHVMEKLGDRGLRRLIAFHVPRDPIQFMAALFAADATKAACKWVYGYAPEKLFEDALASACLS